MTMQDKLYKLKELINKRRSIHTNVDDVLPEELAIEQSTAEESTLDNGVSGYTLPENSTEPLIDDDGSNKDANVMAFETSTEPVVTEETPISEISTDSIESGDVSSITKPSKKKSRKK